MPSAGQIVASDQATNSSIPNLVAPARLFVNTTKSVAGRIMTADQAQSILPLMIQT
jgi:hypothetical protein